MKVPKTLSRPMWFLCLWLPLAGCDSSDGGGGGGERTVLVMGDSLSATGTYPGVRPWPRLLADNRPNLTVVNRALSGERMEQGAARIPDQLSSVQPESVVIFYGSNNAIQDRVDSVGPSLRSAIRAAKAAGVERIVVCTVPRQFGDFTIYNANIAAVNRTLREVAREENVRLANVGSEFSALDARLFPDGLHPNQNGQRILMVTVRERL